MENIENTNSNTPQQVMTQDEVLTEILDNSRKTKSYMKWQLIITVALVVIPLLITAAMIPYALSSLSSVYDVSSSVDGINAESINELLK